MPITYAYHDTDCTGGCYTQIDRDQPVYFHEGEKHCLDCAAKAGLVCPQCQSKKNPKFRVCYECGQASGKPHPGVTWGGTK